MSYSSDVKVSLQAVLDALDDLAVTEADEARLRAFRESVHRMVDVPFHDSLDDVELKVAR